MQGAKPEPIVHHLSSDKLFTHCLNIRLKPFHSTDIFPSLVFYGDNISKLTHRLSIGHRTWLYFEQDLQKERSKISCPKNHVFNTNLSVKNIFFFSYIFEINTWGKVDSRRLTLGTKYSRMVQVKFVEDSL